MHFRIFVSESKNFKAPIIYVLYNWLNKISAFSNSLYETKLILGLLYFIAEI